MPDGEARLRGAMQSQRRIRSSPQAGRGGRARLGQGLPRTPSQLKLSENQISQGSSSFPCLLTSTVYR